MEWLEVFVETKSETIEIICGLLYQCGLTGLMINDENDFKEFLESPDRDWDYIEDGLVKEKSEQACGITFFVRNNASGLETIANVKSGLLSLKQTEKEFDLGSLNVEIKNIKEEDWANNWKKYFKPFAVGEKIIIKPSWEEFNEKTDRRILNIDPGHIFGTGTHETTKLCIEHIENYVKEGNRVLDIGCGSGILSIASLLLGAGYADALDIDPNAVNIAYENSDRNGIDRNRYNVMAGNILEDERFDLMFKGKEYDVIEANIVADIIIALSKMVPEYIKKDGIFISSGIILERLEDVYAALSENGFEVLETKTEKDWAAVASKYIGKR